ncbi:hypothetical protein LOK49_LG08G03264 [Camellia lanceoleosa]|uniref:Uncharacterized protein n=1 Tax=Camellia lanceoleosa TaxID=1840588 RepID=A0ACC0GRZ9_9ERIC|nr:hypothetical protein LOK49_LG08G03264 [Camellia lanceoleosa]
MAANMRIESWRFGIMDDKRGKCVGKDALECDGVHHKIELSVFVLPENAWDMVADLMKIGREGFALLEEFYGTRNRKKPHLTPPPPPPPYQEPPQYQQAAQTFLRPMVHYPSKDPIMVQYPSDPIICRYRGGQTYEMADYQFCKVVDKSFGLKGNQPPPYKVHYLQQVTELAPPPPPQAVAEIDCYEAAKKYNGILLVDYNIKRKPKPKPKPVRVGL